MQPNDNAFTRVATPEKTTDGFKRQFLRELNYRQGVSLAKASPMDEYLALAHTVRAYLAADWKKSLEKMSTDAEKAVAYLSLEYLLGKQLDNSLVNGGIEELAVKSLKELDIDFNELTKQEHEPGLGNGGLGRLAACFIDSLATLDVPAIAYGIRYEYGIFKQVFKDEKQVEEPDNWLRYGSPWEIVRPEQAVTVSFGGHVENHVWHPAWQVQAVPYNYMVPGYQNGRVNTLRLWSAKAIEGFSLENFNYGNYTDAVRAQTFAENISKILYPEDSTPQGKELRLQQQYFFAAASIRDYIDHILGSGFDLHRLPSRITFQLNDTHPVISIPELMRILMDEKGFSWDDAWAVTQKSFAYTCHTLLPEALEVWSVELIERLLPRHMEIIYKINEDFINLVHKWSHDDGKLIRDMSIIQEHPERSVRMAYLAIVGSRMVNGVAELHSELIKGKTFANFAKLWPDRFTNVTNGVTPRRFILESNPLLSTLISSHIGKSWITHLEDIKGIEPLANDAAFRAKFRDIKHENKFRLQKFLLERNGIELNPDSMLDIMIKRFHEYKRQTMKALHVVTMYEQIKTGTIDLKSFPSRTVIFGGKAAPGYAMAKTTIELVNAIAATIDADEVVSKYLQLIFIPNYNVTVAEMLIPAGDLSEQISLAGYEASGTGNMKFALNGALTIGTDDGANVEIRERVGDDNFFLFGMKVPEVEALRQKGYEPHKYYEADPVLKSAIDLIASGEFSHGDGNRFESLVSNLLYEDKYMVLADFASYLKTQDEVNKLYLQQDEWSRRAILNVARSGYFSSDRSIEDYLKRIWH